MVGVGDRDALGRRLVEVGLDGAAGLDDAELGPAGPPEVLDDGAGEVAEAGLVQAQPALVAADCFEVGGVAGLVGRVGGVGLGEVQADPFGLGGAAADADRRWWRRRPLTRWPGWSRGPGRWWSGSGCSTHRRRCSRCRSGVPVGGAGEQGLGDGAGGEVVLFGGGVAEVGLAAGGGVGPADGFGGVGGQVAVGVGELAGVAGALAVVAAGDDGAGEGGGVGQFVGLEGQQAVAGLVGGDGEVLAGGLVVLDVGAGRPVGADAVGAGVLAGVGDGDAGVGGQSGGPGAGVGAEGGGGVSGLVGAGGGSGGDPGVVEQVHGAGTVDQRGSGGEGRPGGQWCGVLLVQPVPFHLVNGPPG